MQDIATYIEALSTINESFLRERHPEFTEETVGVCMAMYRNALRAGYEDGYNKAKAEYLDVINTPTEEDDIS